MKKLIKIALYAVVETVLFAANWMMGAILTSVVMNGVFGKQYWTDAESAFVMIGLGILSYAFTRLETIKLEKTLVYGKAANKKSKAWVI